jgi:four helix bundle protein
MQEGPIVKKSFSFSVSIISYCEYLDSKRRYIIARQLLRSGTSIGANVYEAQYSESRVDFIHKMKIALKEANETFYWISLCEKIDGVPVNQEIVGGIKEIKLILSKIVVTGKNNLTKD